MRFILRGELLHCKKWAESLTPRIKFRFLNCSGAENFFLKTPLNPTSKVFDRILGGEGGDMLELNGPGSNGMCHHGLLKNRL